ncbi:hypothetical protein BDD12DRAFT_839363 [Trichophaea hybrida]|nr:hypothetical protein BDD12DRAFT_839363 [Trichophaea hybrida]
MSALPKRHHQDRLQRWKQNRNGNNTGGNVTVEQRDFVEHNALLLGFDKHAQWIGREKFLSQILPLRSNEEEPVIRAFVQNMNIPRLQNMYKASDRVGQAGHSHTVPSAAIPQSPKSQVRIPSFGSQLVLRPLVVKPPSQQYRPNDVTGVVPGPSAQELPLPQVHALRQDRPKHTGDIPPPPSLSDQACLLESAGTRKRDSEVEKAVMFSSSLLQLDPEAPRLLPQYGLLGIASDIRDPGGPQATDRRVFLNTNYPASFFICGLQGSGKSHTTSCILENHLLKSPILGHIEHPCSAMVFHYGHYTSRETFRPCEAAFLSLRGQQFPNQPAVSTVTVLVSPSNFHALSRSYSQIPGVNVRKLKLLAKDLHVSSLLTLMSCDRKASAPLYMGQVTKVLRDMAEAATAGFDYIDFKARLQALDLTRDQRMPLDQRLDLLESFLDLNHSDPCFDFGPGSLTVVDLSCPFVDENTACVLFNICIGVYLGSESSDKGRIIAVDEAHKYMTDTPASKVLTDRLLSVIREQRHYGVRVIISTQEPTISPRLMDLSSATIIHRFTSPEWYNILRTHISVFQGNADDGMDLFDHIIALDVGQALIFAPSAFVAYQDEEMPRKLNSELVKVAVRKRVTWDGGRSVLCV